MAKQKQESKKPKKVAMRWYASKPVIITTLIFLLPLGLFLMWKYTGWKKKTKWIITASLVALWTLLFIVGYNAPPTIIVNSAKENKISIDSAEYILTGTISTTKKVNALTINGEEVPVASDTTFAHKITLEEGDTIIAIAATNGNGETKENLIIHRATKAELVARAEAEKKQLEDEAKKTQAEKEAKDAEERAKADKEANKEKASAEKQAAKEKAALDKQIAKEKADKEKQAAKEAEAAKKAANSSCNWWCRLTGGGKKQEPQETKKEVAPEIKKPVVAATPKIGETVTSGNFAFIINSVTCGESTISWVYGDIIRYYSTAQGQFCRLNLTVKNIGEYQDNISVSGQYLYNTQGQQWTYSSSATSNAAKYLYGNPLNASINPGNSITGDIVYDIPVGQSPSTAEVDGGLFGAAKKITLQ
jgi:hypothetical protein